MNTKRALATAALFSLIALAGTVCLAETKAAAPAAKAASGEVSYTECKVVDVFTKKDTLAGKNILVKGKVAKFSGGIMGTNWFHIKDGSGSAGTDDLVVTSKNSGKAGDEVVVRGELSTNVDFGSGYKYDVIIQDGKVSAK